MTENNEHIPHSESRQSCLLPWSSAEDILTYRQTLVENDGSGSEQDILNKQRIDVFSVMLQRLPQDDIVLATEVYSLLATDDSEPIRKHVAEHVDSLYIYDQEAGTDLFTCLVNDAESSVRDYAFASVDSACIADKISYTDFKALREIYYDACDREAIRQGILKPRLITPDTVPWRAQLQPWSLSVDTAVDYISDLESKQRNARETAAHEDFYVSLRHLPQENPSLAVELFTALAAHENRDIRARIPSVCALFLYAYEPKAAIDIARALQADQDITIAQSVKYMFNYAAKSRGYDYQEIMRMLTEPAPSPKNKPELRLIQGGK